jgi:hypothetical protein
MPRDLSDPTTRGYGVVDYPLRVRPNVRILNPPPFANRNRGLIERTFMLVVAAGVLATGLHSK